MESKTLLDLEVGCCCELTAFDVEKANDEDQMQLNDSKPNNDFRMILYSRNGDRDWG